MAKERSIQQQIDDKAVDLLRYKFPSEFVFREQDHDFGIDCELEQFVMQQSNPKQSTTGILFKGQVKGSNDIESLRLQSLDVFSKSFSVRDLHYWYDQLSIPVILFLVDIGNEKIYWTDFYSNKKLREDYFSINPEQKHLNVYFSPKQTIPNSIEELLRAVNQAQMRIALSTKKSDRAIQEHLRESKDIENNVRQLKSELEIANYQHLVSLIISEDFDRAGAKAQEILDSSDASKNLKLQVILACEKLFIAALPKDSTHFTLLKKIADSLHFCFGDYQLLEEGIIKSTCLAFDSLFEISLLTDAILEDRKSRVVFGSNTANSLAQISALAIQAREAQFFIALRESIGKLNGLIDLEHLDELTIHLLGFITPDIVRALSPLRHAYSLFDDGESISQIDSYLHLIISLYAKIGELYGDEAVIQRCLSSCILLNNSFSNCEPTYQIMRDIVDTIDDVSYKVKASSILKDIIDKHSAIVKQINEKMQQTDEIELTKQSAIGLLKQQGIHYNQKTGEIDIVQGVDDGIVNVIRKGLKELDLTPYLTDCIHRYIYRPQGTGIPPVAEMFGLGFAASRKSVACFEKKVRVEWVSWTLKDTFDEFYNNHCKDCPFAKPHEPEWKYSYDWQRQKDTIFDSLVSEFKAE